MIQKTERIFSKEPYRRVLSHLTLKMSNIIMIPSCPALKFKIENLILGPVSSKVLSFRLNFSINSRPALLSQVLFAFALCPPLF